MKEQNREKNDSIQRGGKRLLLHLIQVMGIIMLSLCCSLLFPKKQGSVQIMQPIRTEKPYFYSSFRLLTGQMPKNWMEDAGNKEVVIEVTATALEVTQQAVDLQVEAAVSEDAAAVSEPAIEADRIAVDETFKPAPSASAMPVSVPTAKPSVTESTLALSTPQPEAAPTEEGTVTAQGNSQTDVMQGTAGTSDYQPPVVQQSAPQSSYYEIMGNSAVTLSQMVRFYQSKAVYPDFYAGTEAPSIEAFCQIYLEEAATEGVRAEVAFCQAMKETGYLTYCGDVSITQYNFAGIGATGGGAAGYSFAGVREGIRAQIQHLKAYACEDALHQTCVDPRFRYVRRNSAAYVEWLGIQENPNGSGWAAAVNYGTSIVDDYIKKLLAY